MLKQHDVCSTWARRMKPSDDDCNRSAKLDPFFQEQLNVKVKSIYAGLTMVEAKCFQVDYEELTKDRDKKELNCNL